jgi:hypothetical protein
MKLDKYWNLQDRSIAPRAPEWSAHWRSAFQFLRLMIVLQQTQRIGGIHGRFTLDSSWSSDKASDSACEMQSSNNGRGANFGPHFIDGSKYTL